MSKFSDSEGPQPIIAVGLLTQNDLNLLGSGFRRAFMIDDTPCFEELLNAIDAAEQKMPQGASAN